MLTIIALLLSALFPTIDGIASTPDAFFADPIRAYDVCESQYASESCMNAAMYRAGIPENLHQPFKEIAWRESWGWNRYAFGDGDITEFGSWGLWQINVEQHTEKLARRGWQRGDLTDAWNNAEIAWEIYQERLRMESNGFGAWTVQPDNLMRYRNADDPFMARREAVTP